MESFRRGLGETGFIEGQNVAIEFPWAVMARSLGDPDRQVGDLVLFGRLRKLIDAGKLNARGDVVTLRGVEVRLSRR